MTATTEDTGASAQPDDSAAIQPGDMIISQDESGTPAMVPAEQAAEIAQEESSDTSTNQEQGAEGETPQGEEPAQPSTPDDTVSWAKNKGIEIDPNNANEVKLANMQREAERKMHEANQAKPKIAPPEPMPDVEDATMSAIVERQNQMELKNYVTTWFDANPDMKPYREELQRISQMYPDLNNMDHLKAHFLSDPSREAQLRSEGGKAALTNLAQKQSNVPPASAATNTKAFASGAITPQNVYAQIDSHDQKWFEANYEAINGAIAGN